ncbi:MAG: dynamin family protein [Chlorobium sp.]|nr:dynamin family protein [Chlorobium sp.]
METVIALLLRLYETDHDEKKRFAAIRRGLEERLPSIIGRESLKDAAQRKLFSTFSTLASKIVEQAQLTQLRQKNVVGVGGRFSAGKSRFLNAITGMKLLPTDQSPTTAVATYLVYHDVESIISYTANETIVPLTADELQAIAHTFFNKYGIGFSAVLKKIVMGIPTFRWSDIALLDTPGYDNKGQGRQQDEHIAREHLSNCDYVIWLANAGNGTLTKEDIEFITSLRMANPCLVVLNKADKITEGNLGAIIKTFREQLDSADIAYAGVTAFSSSQNREYLGQTMLQDYLFHAKPTEKASLDTRAELDRIQHAWFSINEERRKNLEKTKKNILDGIACSESPQHIRSLIEAYGLHHTRNTELYRQNEAFTREVNYLLKNLPAHFA